MLKNADIYCGATVLRTTHTSVVFAVNTALCAFIPACCYDEPNQTCLMDRRLSISVDTDTHRQLKVTAAQLDVSMNTLVVDAVKTYLRDYCRNGDENSASE